MLSLIFLFVALAPGCNEREDSITPVYEGTKAVAVSISNKLLNFDNDSVALLVTIRIDTNNTGILGNLVADKQNKLVNFRPLLPFEKGRKFSVYYGKEKLGSFETMSSRSENATRLNAVYPSADTLPANLLKLYLVFSSPMRESVSAKYVHVVNAEDDTLSDVLLDLQPELWNESRTVLTIWFDPGRIKRDLQPNLAKGNPLETGKSYSVLVSKDWPDAEGEKLAEDHRKNIIVAARDGSVPGPLQWKLQPPRVAGDPVTILFTKPLDYFLLTECFELFDRSGKKIDSRVRILPGEKGIEIHPANPLSAGSYKIHVLSKLEDVAGNNLNRPFDNDLQSVQRTPVGFVELNFEMIAAKNN